MFGPIRRGILLCPYDHNITKSACFCTWVHSFVYQTVYWCSSEKRLVYTHPKAPVSEHVKPRLHASLKKFHGRYLNSLVNVWLLCYPILRIWLQEFTTIAWYAHSSGSSDLTFPSWVWLVYFILCAPSLVMHMGLWWWSQLLYTPIATDHILIPLLVFWFRWNSLRYRY